MTVFGRPFQPTYPLCIIFGKWSSAVQKGLRHGEFGLRPAILRGDFQPLCVLVKVLGDDRALVTRQSVLELRFTMAVLGSQQHVMIGFGLCRLVGFVM